MKELLDKEVIARDGVKVGKVKDIIVETENWRATGLQIELDKDVAERFHMKKRLGSVTVPVGTYRIEGIGDKVMLTTEVKDILSPVIT